MEDTTTKVGLILEINLENGFYYQGRCVEDTDTTLVIIDKRGDRVQISKSTILVCKEVQDG